MLDHGGIAGRRESYPPDQREGPTLTTHVGLGKRHISQQTSLMEGREHRKLVAKSTAESLEQLLEDNTKSDGTDHDKIRKREKSALLKLTAEKEKTLNKAKTPKKETVSKSKGKSLEQLEANINSDGKPTGEDKIRKREKSASDKISVEKRKTPDKAKKPNKDGTSNSKRNQNALDAKSEQQKGTKLKRHLPTPTGNKIKSPRSSPQHTKNIKSPRSHKNWDDRENIDKVFRSGTKPTLSESLENHNNITTNNSTVFGVYNVLDKTMNNPFIDAATNKTLQLDSTDVKNVDQVGIKQNVTDVPFDKTGTFATTRAKGLNLGHHPSIFQTETNADEHTRMESKYNVLNSNVDGHESVSALKSRLGLNILGANLGSKVYEEIVLKNKIFDNMKVDGHENKYGVTVIDSQLKSSSEYPISRMVQVGKEKLPTSTIHLNAKDKMKPIPQNEEGKHTSHAKVNKLIPQLAHIIGTKQDKVVNRKQFTGSKEIKKSNANVMPSINKNQKALEDKPLTSNAKDGRSKLTLPALKNKSKTYHKIGVDKAFITDAKVDATKLRLIDSKNKKAQEIVENKELTTEAKIDNSKLQSSGLQSRKDQEILEKERLITDADVDTTKLPVRLIGQMNKKDQEMVDSRSVQAVPYNMERRSASDLEYESPSSRRLARKLRSTYLPKRTDNQIHNTTRELACKPTAIEPKGFDFDAPSGPTALSREGRTDIKVINRSRNVEKRLKPTFFGAGYKVVTTTQDAALGVPRRVDPSTLQRPTFENLIAVHRTISSSWVAHPHVYLKRST